MNVPPPSRPDHWPAALVILTFLIFCIVMWLSLDANSLQWQPWKPEQGAGVREFKNNEFRPAHPYSVVPGGIYSPEEFLEAMTDPVVRRHYDLHGVKGLFQFTESDGQASYVSYRMGDETFWTRNKVWIHDGEMIAATDGHPIRARCGNLLSSIPMEPTREDEPLVLYGIGAITPGGFGLDDLLVIEDTGALIARLPMVTLDLQAEPFIEPLPFAFHPQAFEIKPLAWLPEMPHVVPFLPAPGARPGSVAIPPSPPVPEPPTWVGAAAIGLLMWEAGRR